MKKSAFIAVIVIALAAASLYSMTTDTLKGFKVGRFPFYVYRDAYCRINNMLPSGWLGDIRSLKVDTRSAKNPFSGETCIRVHYSPMSGTGPRWTALHFAHNPVNYWNTLRSAYDLTRARNIYFYARGRTGMEVVEFKVIKSREQDPKAASWATLRVQLTREWKKYCLKLDNITVNEMAGGFGFSIDRYKNPAGCEFYLDEIYYTNLDEEEDSLVTSLKLVE